MKPDLARTRLCSDAEACENADCVFAHTKHELRRRRVEHTETVIGDPHKPSIEPLDGDAPKVNVVRAPLETPDGSFDWVTVVNDARLTGAMERFYEREPVYVIPMASDRYSFFQFMCF